jgi:hypothetical protein
MPLESSPVGPQALVRHESDIAGVHFDGARLVVLVASESTGAGRFRGFRVTFSHPSGFRVLDESNLARYWASPGFVPGYHVLCISQGGWAEEESQLQGFEESNRREWLIATGNRCVSVLSHAEPKIEEGEYEDAA